MSDLERTTAHVAARRAVVHAAAALGCLMAGDAEGARAHAAASSKWADYVPARRAAEILGLLPDEASFDEEWSTTRRGTEPASVLVVAEPGPERL